MNALNLMIAKGWEPTADITATKRNALVNAGLEQDVMAQPQKQHLAAQELRLRELALDIQSKAMQMGEQPGPISMEYDWGTISGPRNAIIEASSALAQYPDQANDPNFMPWLAQRGISVKAKEKKAAESGKTRTINRGTEEITQEWDGTQWKDISKAPRWNPEKPGMKVYDKEGNLIVDTGGGPPMTKPTQNKVEEKLLGGKEQLSRMIKIASEFKPEYQEIGSRWARTWTGIKASLGRDVPPEDAKALTDWKKFQRKSIENINLYIKELTGAQMSEKEANRLRLAQPDPGENWWQGDDPITFKAKMDDVIKMTRASIARYEYYRARGLSDSEINGLINSDSAISLDNLASKME